MTEQELKATIKEQAEMIASLKRAVSKLELMVKELSKQVARAADSSRRAHNDIVVISRKVFKE